MAISFNRRSNRPIRALNAGCTFVVNIVFLHLLAGNSQLKQEAKMATKAYVNGGVHILLVAYSIAEWGAEGEDESETGREEIQSRRKGLGVCYANWEMAAFD